MICRLHNWRKILSDECTEHIQACYKTTCNWHYVKKYRKVFLGYNEMWLIDRKYIFIYVKRCNWMIYYPLQYFFQAMCCQRPNKIRLYPIQIELNDSTSINFQLSEVEGLLLGSEHFLTQLFCVCLRPLNLIWFQLLYIPLSKLLRTHWHCELLL